VPVTVVGSLDEDVLVRVARLPGRGETVVGEDVVLAPGGKGANQAAAARRGPGVAMVGRVGEDDAGARQRAALAAAGVDVAGC
jgi:ribokinase